MKPSLNKLQKVLKLEAERGYDNHAVVGGLERLLDHWIADARADGVPEDLIQLVNTRLRDYSHLAATSRAEMLEGLIKRITRSEQSTLKPESPTGSPRSSNTGRKEQKRPAKQPSSGKTDSRNQPAPRSAKKETDGSPKASSLEIEAEEGFDSPTEFPQEKYPAQPEVVQEQPAVEPAALSASVTVLPGIGPKHAQTLERLGIRTLRDMLYYLPRRYDDYSRLKPINRVWYGEEVTVLGAIQSTNTRYLKGNRFQIVEIVLHDGTGALRVNWFNQSWLAKRLRPGIQIVISGKIDQYLGRLIMNNPEWEPLEEEQLSTNRIVPVYPLTANITQRWLRRMINEVVQYWAPRVPDMLPPDLRRSAGVIPISLALRQIHFPDSWDDLNAARNRLAFDEIFLLQIGVQRQKRSWQERKARPFPVESSWLSAQIEQLPYSLTGAQTRAINDITHDLSSGNPMNRLLQGDVGSGKTVVAALAAAIVTSTNAQVAFMAPTSILAEQHYQSLQRLLSSPKAATPINDTEIPSEGQPEPQPTEVPLPGILEPAEIRLMTGATPEAEKREIRAGLEKGAIKLIVGTHALLEEPVQFADLEFAVIDEQHRFGVEQRAILRSKGESPHLLVMTATPIPRSLALTVYGDLDLTVMDEMPPGRQPINTYLVTPRERERVYTLIRNQVELGRQAFIIYPLIEESDKSESKAAVEEHANLQTEIFPHLKLGLLHGRMKSDEKDQVMTRFRDGEYHILVSTTVVEVGVDIPNATVMVIEGADRFGLSQLHQLRGRVGRGSEASHCILIPTSSDETENERLKAMLETNDGFVLAERDLEQRGPGSFLGTRQSGFAELQMANLTNVHIIENARKQVQLLLEQNPELSGIEFAALQSALERFWSQTSKGDIS